MSENEHGYSPETPQQTDSTNESQALVKSEFSEVELEQDIKKLQLEANDLDLPETAEAKLNRMETAVSSLAEIVPKISVKNYKENNEAYNQAVVELQTEIAKLESLLVSFETTVKLEYPKIPMVQKFTIFVLSLVRDSVRESTLIQTFGGNKAKEAALMGSLEKFRELINHHKDSIESVEKFVYEEQVAPIRRRQQAKLFRNKKYQDLLIVELAKKNTLEHALLSNYTASNKASYRFSLENTQREIKAIEDDVWTEVLNEMEKEDNHKGFGTDTLER